MRNNHGEGLVLVDNPAAAQYDVLEELNRFGADAVFPPDGKRRIGKRLKSVFDKGP